jgi:chromosome segregation ATPase
MAEKLKINE